MSNIDRKALFDRIKDQVEKETKIALCSQEQQIKYYLNVLEIINIA